MNCKVDAKQAERSDAAAQLRNHDNLNLNLVRLGLKLLIVIKEHLER